MMTVLSLSLRDDRNIGDARCSPHWYFAIPGDHLPLNSDDHPAADVIIFGGGAIAGRASKYQTPAKKIAWGVGSTRRGVMGPPPDHDVRGFELYGSRDYGHGDWVPCASCMAPEFDNVPDPVTPFAMYGHAQLSPMRWMNNDCMDFARVIAHLATGETVVTSSYHGMYWSLLMGRRVVARPFGAKFFGLPWRGEWDGRDLVFESDRSRLDEARSANRAFWERGKRYV
jgi:hypothetical protein